MKQINITTLRRQRSLLFRFLSSLFLLGLIGVFSTNKSFSQNSTTYNCTSNDVRIISAYISGAGNTAIDCGATNPFDGAELHLIVSSNTQRIGISLVGVLNIIDNSNTITASINLANCFTGVTLNNGSNNNLVYSLGSQLDGVQCGPGFSLSNVFIAWGTGNTDFCMGSNLPQDPATPAKCRFKEGETIPVTVKLDVDFSFTEGVCNEGGNSLALDFTPTVTAQNVNYPLTFVWDFGDASATVTTSAASADDVANAGTSHTYASAGTYTATLTVSDASDPAVTKTAVHTFILTACCNLAAPQVTAGPFCSADNKTIADLPQTDGNGGTYHWYNAADPNNSFELPGTTLLVDGTTYYVSVSVGTCESARTAVTITINPTPDAPTVTAGPFCVSDGKTIADLPQGGGPYKYYDAQTGGNLLAESTVIPVGTNTYWVSTTSSAGCESGRSSVSVTVNPNPTVNGNTSASLCVGKTSQLAAETTSPGGTYSATNGNASVSTSGLVTGISAGMDTIIYTVTSNLGCTSHDSAFVTVNGLPDCTISASNNSNSVSVGATATYSTTTSNQTYGWSIRNSSNTILASSKTASITYTFLTVGTYTVYDTVTNSTGCISYCSYQVTVTATGPFYSVTQGFYGNVGGKVCIEGTYYVAGTKSTVPGLIAYSINNMPGHMLALGAATITSTSKSFRMTATSTEINNLIQYMPGTQTAALITANSGNNNNTNITSNLPKLYNKKISNVLLAQAITLALNVSIPNNTLGSFILKSGYYLTTQKTDPSTCPTTKVLACTSTNSAISSLKITTNAGLISWLNQSTKTVQDLMNLASYVLGGGAPPTGATLTDINNAVDVINRSFDGGSVFLGYYATQQSCLAPLSITSNTSITDQNIAVTKLAVTAYPNPFTDKVTFSIASPVSGKASLDIYNIMGQKLHTVYQGYLFAGRGQVIEYNVPATFKGALIYTLRVGDKQVNGKVIQIK